MKDELAIEKAKKYLIKLKKSKVLKKQSELLELKVSVVLLNILCYNRAIFFRGNGWWRKDYLVY